MEREKTAEEPKVFLVERGESRKTSFRLVHSSYLLEENPFPPPPPPPGSDVGRDFKIYYLLLPGVETAAQLLRT